MEGNLKEKTIKIIFKSSLDYLPLISQASRTICSSLVNDGWILYQLELCLVEAISNIIIHAYKNKNNKEIELVLILNPNSIVFKLYDSGAKYSYQEKTVAAEENQDIASFSESGRGLLIMKKFMDDVKTIEEDGKNVIILKKLINKKNEIDDSLEC